MEKYLEERITYLFNTEITAIDALDKIAVGTLERSSQWDLIRELSNRRHELKDALKFFRENAAPKSGT